MQIVVMSDYHTVFAIKSDKYAYVFLVNKLGVLFIHSWKNFFLNALGCMKHGIK